MPKYIDNQMDSQISENYTEVRKEVYGWALERRLEAKGAPQNGAIVKGSMMGGMDIPSELPGPTTPYLG